MEVEYDSPAIGTRWRHRNGNIYVVIFIANEPGNDRYPRTVIYVGGNEKVWARRVDDWHRSMTLVPSIERNTERNAPNGAPDRLTTADTTV
jgi:hypothetical protein